MTWSSFARVAFHSVDMDGADDVIDACLVCYGVDDLGDCMGPAESEL